MGTVMQEMRANAVLCVYRESQRDDANPNRPACCHFGCTGEMEVQYLGL